MLILINSLPRSVKFANEKKLSYIVSSEIFPHVRSTGVKCLIYTGNLGWEKVEEMTRDVEGVEILNFN